MQIRYRRELGSLIQHLGVHGDAAEIGVAEGFFAADMLSWPVAFPRVYLVDRWQTIASQKGDASHPQSWHDRNYEAAKARVATYGARAVFLRGHSVEMAQKVPCLSLALVNIDGDHSFQGVVNDAKAWLPKLAPGGVMAFHDYLNRSYGVMEAVKLISKSTGYAIHLLPEDKEEDAGAYLICK